MSGVVPGARGGSARRCVDPAVGLLEVTFESGGTYQYEAVPADVQARRIS
ncbi:hypothetical protein ACSHWB_38340 [Lentzea sp. HUAS TT2]